MDMVEKVVQGEKFAFEVEKEEGKRQLEVEEES